METNRKPFDSTVCYTFFGSWLSVIEKLETEEDEKSVSYRLFKAISYYSLFGAEPDFSDLDEICRPYTEGIWIAFSRDIENSMNRRKRGFAKEQTTELQEAIITQSINTPDASLREIASVVGCSRSTVERTQKKYAQRIKTGILEVQDNRPVQSEEEYDDDLPF